MNGIPLPLFFHFFTFFLLFSVNENINIHVGTTLIHQFTTTGGLWIQELGKIPEKYTVRINWVSGIYNKN